MPVNFQKKQGKGAPRRPEYTDPRAPGDKAGRDALGRFPKGQSGNPAGRPMGSRNAATQLAEALLDGEAEALTRALIDRALEGDPAMLRLAVERIVPRRARTHAIALPEIKSAADLTAAIDAIARAAAEGAITPFDAAELARMVETRCARSRSVISTAASPNWSARSKKPKQPPTRKQANPGGVTQGDITMHRRLKSFEQRFARIAAFIRADSVRMDREHGLRHARQVMAELIREGLRRAGLNPDDSPRLRELETPEPLPPPRRWRPIDPREAFCDRMEALAARMRAPPPLATAPPIELLAYYCFGAGAVA
jgi:hypothetical protein